jgi:hypothetical protein
MATVTSANWVPTEDRLPEQGVEVDAMDSGGNVQRLVLESNLWWFPDRSMYVYFTPKFWRPL